MKPLYYYPIFFFSLYLAPLFSQGQTPVVSASANKNKILIGEQLDIRIQVSMPDNTNKLSWIETSQPFGAFTLVSKDPIDTGYATGSLTYTQILQLTSFDSGSQVIPPLSFQFESMNNDSSFQISTDSIPVEVSYSPDDGVQPFHDIKPIIQVSKKLPWWAWPAIITAAILLAIFVVWLIRKKNNGRQGSSTSLSGYEETIRALQALRKENLPETGEYKIYYIKIRQIFKKYLTQYTNRNQDHLTSEDLIMELSGQMKDRELFNKFVAHIRMGDAVKFAKYQPSQAECTESMNVITTSVNVLHQQQKQRKDDL